MLWKANGTLGKAYTASTTAAPSATEFVYAEDSGKITLPTGVTGTLIAKYEYEQKRC